MASNAGIVMWMGFLAVIGSAAAGRELSESPVAAPDATTATSEDVVLEWLKITAVPLGVFLVGASTWGCIKESVVWRSLTSQRRGVSGVTPELDEVAPAEQPIGSSSHDGSDLEEGSASSHHRMDDGPAMSSVQQVQTMQQPALQTPTDDRSGAARDVAPGL